MPRFADQEQPPNGQTHPPRQPHVPARARPLSAAPLPASQSYPGRIGRCLYAMTVFLRERLKYCTCRRRQFKPSRLPYLHTEKGCLGRPEVWPWFPQEGVKVDSGYMGWKDSSSTVAERFTLKVWWQDVEALLVWQYPTSLLEASWSAQCWVWWFKQC